MDADTTRKPRILMITPEATYLPQASDRLYQIIGARAGELADISAGLIHSLYDLQMDVHVAIPDYRNVFQKNSLPVNSVEHLRRYERLPSACVHRAKDRSFFYRPSLSSLPVRENIRIALAFQREVINRIIPEVRPDLIHCFDWMTGLIPAVTRQFGIPCLFTLYHPHTVKVTLAAIEEQGIDAASFWQKCYFEHMPGSYESTRGANPVDFLVSAVFAAHFVNLVSRSFLVQLIETEDYDIEPSLRQELHHKSASGCLSVIEHAPDPTYNPACDRLLCRRYTPENQETGKAFNKLHLQEKLCMPLDTGAPLFLWPGRLDRSSNRCRLLAETLPALLHRHAAMRPQVLFVADGDFQNELCRLVRDIDAADQVVVTGFNSKLQRIAYAAADFVLLPAGHVPCGLACKIAQRYGALPIAHGAGAIRDVLIHLDCSKNSGNGFIFNNLDVNGLLWAVEEAMTFYRAPRTVRRAQLNRLMAESLRKYDHSQTVNQYVRLYEAMLQRPFVRHDSGDRKDPDSMMQSAA